MQTDNDFFEDIPVDFIIGTSLVVVIFIFIGNWILELSNKKVNQFTNIKPKK